MDIIREFLESSTIHGLAYIATAKVFQWLPFIVLRPFLLVQGCKDFVVWDCLSWVCRRWDFDRQVVQGVAGVANRHLDHHSPN